MFFAKGNVLKERAEAFTNAAAAIIACLVISEITTERFLTSAAVEEDGFSLILKHLNSEYSAVFGTYITVSLLWHINHTNLHIFHTIDMTSSYLQKIFLAVLCMAPISYHMIVKFGLKGNLDTQISALWANVMILQPV